MFCEQGEGGWGYEAVGPQGPGGPARAYRYRLALRRPYRSSNRRWARMDGVRPQGPGEPARASATVWR